MTHTHCITDILIQGFPLSHDIEQNMNRGH